MLENSFEKNKINKWIAKTEARAEAYAKVNSAYDDIDNANIRVGGLGDYMTEDDREKVFKLLAEAMAIVEAARDEYA